MLTVRLLGTDYSVYVGGRIADAGQVELGSASFTADMKAERRLRKVSPLTTEVDGPDAPQVGPVAGQQAPPRHRQ